MSAFAGILDIFIEDSMIRLTNPPLPLYFALLFAALSCLSACSQSGDDDDDSASGELFSEDPSFTHPATWLYAHFDTASDAELAFVVRAIETNLLASVDFDSTELIDRSPALDALSESDLEGLNRPSGDPALCQSVTLATRSVHAVSRHAVGALQVDQSGGDPSTPDHYSRSFTGATELCWASWDCDVLRAEDSLTRVNPLFSISMSQKSDHRWVDLGLPSPSTVLLGTEAPNDGPARWAIVMRSWLPEAASNDSGSASFQQAYALGLWLSQDANPLLPVMRYTASWTQTLLPVSLDDSTLRQLTRGAINDAYEAQEDWISTLP